jgi:cell division septation protein DedD
MADQSDRNQGSDDLYDEATPRSIFAATWFRAVLVLIVLGVIGAVAVPYILDAMNPPAAKLSATPTPLPPVPAPGQSPSVMMPPAATPTPGAPPSATTTPAPTTPLPATAVDRPADKKDAMTSGTSTAPEPAKPEPKPTSTPKPTATVEAPSKPAPKVARATTSAGKRVSRGQWFVQVGAFKDPAAAGKVAAKLRED